jgi:uncharacterized protein
MLLRITELRLPVDHDEEDLVEKVLKMLRAEKRDLRRLLIRRRSIDARKRENLLFLYTVDVDVLHGNRILARRSSSSRVMPAPDLTYSVGTIGKAAPEGVRPVIVGTGPCGLFAGLLLAQAGLRPILLERGRAVEERVMDVKRFWRTGELLPRSNVQFGEGGAGTFSDGKLVTRIKDRHNRCRKVLDELVAAGAPEEILVDAKPHIGTDRLVRVVANLRRAIRNLGGEVRFDTQVTDLLIEGGRVRGVTVDGGETIDADVVVLAIGHSARDTLAMLDGRGVPLEAKPFSIGLRVEHPQNMIDLCRYGELAGHPDLGHAEYQLTHHCSGGRTVYTFCMCPGGRVINASSEEGRLVVNGMSLYRRDEANANSALLVGVNPSDFESGRPLAGVAFQRFWEEKAFALGGGGFRAPVQRVGDFLARRPSSGDAASFAVTPSCTPGVTPGDLGLCLPDYALEALVEAIPAFDRKIAGFAMPDALLTGVETRSSSPVRILRGDDFESSAVEGLYPAGEGSGYAGGIVSSAVDGIKVAEAIAGKVFH